MKNASKVCVAALVAITGGCSSRPSENVSSSTAPLTVGSTTFYGQATPNNFQPGSVSTAAVFGTLCQQHDSPDIVTAWESRFPDGSGTANAIDWAVACNNLTTPIRPAQQLTTVETGVPPEWNSPAPMIWLGQPHLVPVGPAGWIALVGLVGQGPFGDQPADTTLTAHNMATVISKDGGNTWDPNSVHLVAPVDGSHGGTDFDSGVIVSDWTATAATWNNANGNHDIFVVWYPHATSSTWATTVTYDALGHAAVMSTPVVAANSKIMLEPSLVAGTHSILGNFVFLMAPKVGSLPASACPQGTKIPQAYQTFFSGNAPVGSQWFTGVGLTNQNQFRCAGGAHDALTSIYPTGERAALVYDAPANQVISATTHVRQHHAQGDTSNSMAVVLNGFSWCACNDPNCKACQSGAPGAPSNPTQIAESSKSDVGLATIEDQIDPILSVDPSSGQGLVAWYDTAELASTTDNVSSVHGAVQLLTSPSLPGGQPLFLPQPTRYAFGNDLALYNAATALGDGQHFAASFVDGLEPFFSPDGQGGLYTIPASP